VRTKLKGLSWNKPENDPQAIVRRVDNPKTGKWVLEDLVQPTDFGLTSQPTAEEYPIAQPAQAHAVF
jgi:hypothetical protein